MGYITEPQPRRMVAPMIEYECDGCQKRYKSRTASSMVHLKVEPYVLYFCSGDCLLNAIIKHVVTIESFSVAEADFPDVINYIVYQ